MGRGLKLLAILLLVVAVAAVAFSVGAPADCDQPTSGGDGGTLSSRARDEIPADAARMYAVIAKRWSIDVAFLASIGKQECDHGRCPDLKQVNYAGCVGWMQLGVGGRCGDFWARNRCDGNRDGRMDVLDPWDNVCAAARGLRKEKGAPPAGGSEAGYRRAACNYYGACRDRSANYAEEVMARAKHYGFPAPTATGLASTMTAADGDDEPPVGCVAPEDASTQLAAAGGPGKPFDLIAGANRAGVGLTKEMQTVTRQIAGLLPRRLKVCTGTNHNRLSSSGNVSDHWAGNGVDLCSSANGFPATGGGYGDAIATAALIVAGKSRADAARMARQGGAFTIVHNGIRFQIIWKSQIGGNHDDHVHVGIDPSTGRAA